MSTTQTNGYPVTLTPEPEGGFTVTFADIPEAISYGATQEEALDMGLDALVTAMDFYFEDRRSVPLPSKAKKDQATLKLPESVWLKVLLLNEVCAQNVRPIDLANRMGAKRQEVNRLLNLHHATKVDTIARAFEALGKSLRFSIA